MKVYISGKIGERVISDATRQKFARAEAMLRAKGYEVENPASEDYQMAMNSWIDGLQVGALTLCEEFNRLHEIMQYDFNHLSMCNAIYMLEDFKESDGAELEFNYAKYIGVSILFQSDVHAQYYLWGQWHAIYGKKYKSPRVACIKAREYANKHLHELWLPID